MTRLEALELIRLYKDQSPEVILSALELAGLPGEWCEPYSEPTPWKPKEFNSELEYQIHRAHYQMLEDLNRRFFGGL